MFGESREEDFEIAAELPEDLPACAAWRGGIGRVGDNRDATGRQPGDARVRVPIDWRASEPRRELLMVIVITKVEEIEATAIHQRDTDLA